MRGGLVLLLLTAFLLSCNRSQTRADTEPPPIEIKATVQPVQTATITAQLDGKVQSIAVHEGTKIAANGPIAELTNPTVEREVAHARAQSEWIESRARRRARSAPATNVRPHDGVEITAKILEVKRQRLEKMRQLRKTNDISQRELEYAEVEYLNALRDYNNERRALVVTPPPDDSDALRIERQQNAAEIRFAAQRQAQLQISSPIAGTVSRVFVTQGQAVFPRDPIAEVSDTSRLHVRGNVAPELLRYIKPGTRVDVRIMSVPPRSFADEVEYVIPASGAEASTAAIVVTIPNPDGSLQANTPAVITVRPSR